VSKDTIVNCWRKSGLIDCKETREEVENLIEKEKSKYTTELEEELKLIGREAFFKQFIHPSLKSEIISCDDFIDLENDEFTTPKLTDEEIVNVVCTKKVSETEIQSDEEDKEESLNVTTKEAFGAFKIVSQYIEQSTEYNDQKLELLAKVDDCLLEINQSYLKQKRINEYFKKITLNPSADYFKKN
jgi:hypothetical protein